MRDGCWVVDKPPIGSLFALHVLLLPCDHRPLGCSQEYCNMRNRFPGACRGGREVAGPAHHKQRRPSTSYTFRAAGGDAFSLILTIIPPYLQTHPEKPPCRRCCGYASRAVGTWVNRAPTSPTTRTWVCPRVSKTHQATSPTVSRWRLARELDRDGALPATTAPAATTRCWAWTASQRLWKRRQVLNRDFQARETGDWATLQPSTRWQWDRGGTTRWGRQGDFNSLKSARSRKQAKSPSIQI